MNNNNLTADMLRQALSSGGDDHPDTREEAQPIHVTALEPAQLTGIVDSTDDVDWFAITCETPCRKRVVFASEDSSVKIEAFDHNMSPLQLERDIVLDGANPCYFKVSYQYIFTKPAYTIDIQSPAIKEDDYPDTPEETVLIDLPGGQLYTLAGELHDYYDVDWFQFGTETDLSIGIQFECEDLDVTYELYDAELNPVPPFYKLDSGERFYVKVMGNQTDEPVLYQLHITTEVFGDKGLCWNDIHETEHRFEEFDNLHYTWIKIENFSFDDSFTLEVRQGGHYNISANGFSVREFVPVTVRYNPEELHMTRFAGEAPAAGLTISEAPFNGLEVMGFTEGEITFVRREPVPDGKEWFGPLSIMEFEAEADARTSLQIELTR